MCNIAPKCIVWNFVKTMTLARRKEFFVTSSVFELSVIKFTRPKGNWFVILDNVSSHLIAESLSVNVKGFIVVRIIKEAILCHKRFHMFEGKIHFRFPDLLERGAKLCAHCGHMRW